MIKLKLEDIQILHMNRASLTIQIPNEFGTVYISRRVFNQLLSDKEIEGKVVIKTLKQKVCNLKHVHNSEQQNYLWFAALTVF